MEPQAECWVKWENDLSPVGTAQFSHKLFSPSGGTCCFALGIWPKQPTCRLATDYWLLATASLLSLPASRGARHSDRKLKWRILQPLFCYS